jgi:hypothetical protein
VFTLAYTQNTMCEIRIFGDGASRPELGTSRNKLGMYNSSKNLPL